MLRLDCYSQVSAGVVVLDRTGWHRSPFLEFVTHPLCFSGVHRKYRHNSAKTKQNKRILIKLGREVVPGSSQRIKAKKEEEEEEEAYQEGQGAGQRKLSVINALPR